MLDKCFLAAVSSEGGATTAAIFCSVSQGQSLTQLPSQRYLDLVLTFVALLAAWLGWTHGDERAARS